MSWDWIIDQYLMEIDEWLAEDCPTTTPAQEDENVEW